MQWHSVLRKKKKKTKNKKKVIDGYYFDGKKCITLYKDIN